MGTMFYQSAGAGRLRALIWKDYRVNRLLLIVGALLLVVPYLVVAFPVWRSYGAGAEFHDAWEMENALFLAGYCSLCLSCLTFAMLGGNLIAGERADASAEFLGSLPPSRAKILVSKAILVSTTFGVIWGANLPLMFPAWRRLVEMHAELEMAPLDPSVESVLACIGATALVLFGVGWLASSLLSSPTFAIAAALPVPLAVGIALSVCRDNLAWPADVATALWYHAAICALLGTTGLIGGTWYYLRRVEP